MLGHNRTDAGGLGRPAGWGWLVSAVVLLIPAAGPAIAIPQPDPEPLTLPSQSMLADSGGALALPGRPGRTGLTDRSSLAYAPEAAPAVMTLAVPSQSPADPDTVPDPTGPSSAALLAIGLGMAICLMRSRRWVR